MTIRPFKLDDAEALAVVFRDAVHIIGPQCYSAEQVKAWASCLGDLENFRIRLSQGLTLVAEDSATPIAFGQLHPHDHLEYLYCSPAHARKGIASAIYSVLESHARAQGVSEIHTEASRNSRPFLEKQGYVVVTTEQVIRHGVEIERFRMCKNIRSAPKVMPAISHLL